MWISFWGAGQTVTAAVIIHEGRVLITRRKPGEKLAGLWEFPGGKVEPGETLEDCLARELREELDLVVSVGTVLAESIYHYEHGSIRLVALQTEVCEGTITLSVHDKAEWVHPRDLCNFSLAPADIAIAVHLEKILTATDDLVVAGPT
jgi:8-oxo-dGTP diphosphatase